MSENLNPYVSPPSSLQQPSWWSRLLRYFGIRSPPADKSPVFENGDPIICEGIAFFIDPQNAALLYAASPSEDESDERLDLIRSEALRVLPQFLEAHPTLRPLVHGRRLTVGLIDNYFDRPVLRREIAVGETPVEPLQG